MNCSLKKNKNRKSCKDVGEAEFRMVIPKNDNSGKPIKLKVLNKYIGKVNKIFGGSTTIPTTKGCYVDKNKLYCENGFLISGVRDFDSKYNDLSNLSAKQRRAKLNSDYNQLKRLAKQAGKELGQDSIFIESDYINDASFIPGTWTQSLPKSKLGNKEIFTD